jgi:hypothetical protein
MEKAVIITSEGDTSVVEFEMGNSYELLSETVQGYIECVSLPSLGVDMWINEEGKILQLPQNPKGNALWVKEYGLTDYIAGNIVFTRVNDEGETIGLTDEQIEALIAVNPVRVIGLP